MVVRCSVLLGTLLFGAGPTLADDTPPPVMREFRGVWIATVSNIDWPSKPGLPAEAQQGELIAILDRAADLNFNAIIFQVRPAADAMYQSKLEPWSAYLTGTQGRPPEPFYDPLEFAVRESHARGLELHAWINPYRAQFRNAPGEAAETHLSQTHPELVKTYGRYLWMDPGEPAVQNHSLAVVKDIVTRYDVDGIHLDDYFYPYKEADDEGNIIEFPDDPSYKKYRDAGGTLARDDWRRHNVDEFIRRLYKTVKAERPEVLVGLSPFGIWRPGHPQQIQGFDAYAELYADSRKWLREGWCDYFTPQLYWPVGQTPQDYIALQNWWIEQNIKDRHLWPGLYTGRVGEQWEPVEIVKQIEASRESGGATGNIHFSMRSLMRNRTGLERAIRKLYAEPALVPAPPGLNGKAFPAPGGIVVWESEDKLSWPAREQISRWVIQYRQGKDWQTRILPGSASAFTLPSGADTPFLTVVLDGGHASGPVAIRRD